MSETIICVTDEEAPCFQDTDERGFAVRLTFETDAADEDVARQAFEAFLRRLENVRFAMYRLDGGLLLRIAHVVHAEPFAFDLCNALIAWLPSQQPTAAPSFYRTAPQLSETVKTADTLDARDVVLGIAGSVAPLPQRLHLAFVIRVKRTEFTKDTAAPVVVLPHFEVDAPETHDGTGAKVGEYFPLETAGVRCLSIVSAFGRVETAIDLDAGFARADGFSQEAHQTLARLEQRSGSLISGFLAANEVTLPLPEGTHLELATANDGEERARVRRQSWRAITALATAFDTILIALRMPGSARRDGALLGSFLDHLQGSVRDAAGAIFSRGALRTAVRQALTALPALTLVPTTPPERMELVSSLRVLARLPNQPTVLDADTDWLTWLLHGYVHAEDGGVWQEVVNQARTIGQSDASDRPNTLVERWARQDREFERQLADLHDSLTSESGMEAVVLRVLRYAPVEEKFWQAIGVPPPAPENKGFANALEAWEREFAAAADGAAAARQAVGSLIADQLSPGVAFVSSPGELLKANFIELDFWARRFALRTPPATGLKHLFSELFEALIRPIPEPSAYFAAIAGTSGLVDDWTDTDTRPGMHSALLATAEQMTRTCANELFPPPQHRFRPDATPPPIALQVTLDPTADDDDDLQVDEFATAFAGVSVLLRRHDQDGPDPPWSYACLAELQCDPTPQWMLDMRSIAPLPTTVCDGRLALFVPYDGLPFTSAAHAATLPEGDGDAPILPFYSIDYPEDVTQVGAPLPPLAYGTVMEVAAHVVGRAGSLPRVLQGPLPWIPSSRPDLPQDAVGFPSIKWSERTPYSRTTAIGGTAITDATSTPRIGTSVENLFSLLAESPRLAVSSTGVVDVFRNVDGHGAIAVPEPGAFETHVALRDIRQFRGKGSAQKLQIAPMSDATVTHEFPSDVNAFVTIDKADVACLDISLHRAGPSEVMLEFYDGKQLIGSIKLLPSSASLWLRLRLAESGAGESVSLSDPAAEMSGPAAATRPAPANLLIMPSHNAALWRSPFNLPTQVHIETPRIPLVDWMRWVAHPELRATIFGTSEEARKRGNRFYHLLVAAAIERTEDRQLSALLDQLPDPAVVALRVEAAPLDGLRNDPESLQQTYRATHVDIKVPTIGQVLEDTQNNNLWSQVQRNQAKAALLTLARVLGWQLTIQTQKNGAIELDKTAKNLRLPEGMCVRLSAIPVVPPQLFEDRPGAAPFLSRKLLQLASGQLPAGGAFSQGYCFGGATLQIETMMGALAAKTEDEAWQLTREHWTELAFSFIKHKGTSSARQYRLVAEPNKHAWQWRQLGTVGVLTQRWRFTGRPIDRWFKPDNSSGMTSVEVREDYPLYDFEEDAFGDRDAGDADLRTARLEPDYGPTTLSNVAWEHPSATVFRHRFELKSRYIGAMRRPVDGQCNAWAPTVKDQKAWLRVAMLGTRSRTTLTRPQLRALLPLTASTNSETDKTPPILAMLQESPYAFGGLAERLAAEIRSGVGYAMQSNNKIGPHDVRREVGPDPRLSYSATPGAEGARLMLQVDGPLGLSFEPDLRVAAFPNTAVMLHPRRIGADGLESANIQEHLLSVGMRRYLDPSWLVLEPVQTAFVFSETWISSFSANVDTALTISPAGTTDGKVLTIVDAQDPSEVEIRIAHWAVDDTSEVATHLTLAIVPVNATIALLHSPLDERRASVAILLQAKSHPDTLLASVEWALPSTVPGATLSIIAGNQARELKLTSASNATPVNWTRTQRDFDTLMKYDATSAERTKPVAVSTLSAALTNESLFFVENDSADVPWLRASQAGQRFPVHAQRHMAIVPTQKHSRFGRDLTVPIGAYLASCRQVGLDAASRAAVSGVQVLEFEVPARILGHIPGADQNSYLPADFRQAYFDLTAIGFADPIVERFSLSFFARLIGSRASLQSLSELTLEIRRDDEGRDDEADWHTITIARDINGIELAATVIDGIWKDNKFVLEAKFITASGDVQKTTTQMKDIDWQPRASSTQGLWLRFQTPPANELWMEVSMLASPQTDTPPDNGYLGQVDFDWFFGRDPGESAIAIREPAMRASSEAQARLITVSPEIVITKRQ